MENTLKQLMKEIMFEQSIYKENELYHYKIEDI